jgi:phosphonopyruvate decarboxylase
MFHASAFVERATSLGYDLYTGVPCSFLKPLINHVIDDASAEYVAMSNEGEAVAYAAGAYLAGRRPIVMFQNSGLGNAVNAITSLLHPFRIPLLLLATWRGEPGIGDEPQHELMGRVTGPMLSLMEVENDVVADAADALHRQLERARAHAQRTSLPFGLVLRQDTVEPYRLRTTVQSRRPAEAGRCAEPEEGPAELRRADALRLLAEVVGEEHPIIATTGKTGRELFTLRDSANHLYLVGSMGAAASVGLGVARHVAPERRVVVVDGDGAALMRLEALASVGHYRPENLVHVILDNNAHDSTGGQQTLSDTVEFDRVAAAVGYRYARSVRSAAHFEAELAAALRGPGPSLLHLRIGAGSLEPLGRPTVTPAEVCRRLRAHLGADAS